MRTDYYSFDLQLLESFCFLGIRILAKSYENVLMIAINFAYGPNCKHIWVKTCIGIPVGKACTNESCDVIENLQAIENWEVITFSDSVVVNVSHSDSIVNGVILCKDNR